MTSPSWRQLAAIPESTAKAAILQALDITPPPAGISNVFSDRGLYVMFSPAQDSASYWIVSRAGDDGVRLSAMGYADGSDALRACRCPAGTPMGTALRAWMRSKGWLPEKERDVAAAQADTKTII